MDGKNVRLHSDAPAHAMLKIQVRYIARLKCYRVSFFITYGSSIFWILQYLFSNTFIKHIVCLYSTIYFFFSQLLSALPVPVTF